MSRQNRRSAAGIVLTLVLSLALVATGWAHRMPAPVAADAPAWVAYLAAGGDADALCAHNPDPRHHRGQPTAESCAACRLVSGAMLPVPGGCLHPPALLARLPDSPPVVTACLPAPPHTGWQGRAPPRA